MKDNLEQIKFHLEKASEIFDSFDEDEKKEINKVHDFNDLERNLWKGKNACYEFLSEL